MYFPLLKQKEVLSALKTSLQGLSEVEVRKRQQQYGKNELTLRNRFAFFKKILSPFSSLFVVILIIGGAISYFSGHPTDALIISIVIVINALIEYIQTYSASRVLRALKQFDTHQITVKRDGKLVKVDAVELVAGDIVILTEGQKIPADCRLLEADGLEVDESSLTGESLPVTKTSQSLSQKLPVFEQANMVFKGTLIASGRGLAAVTAIGNSTQLGAVAELASQDNEKAPISQKIDQLTLRLVSATLVVAAMITLLGIVRGNSLEEMVRFAIALSVSVIPEGLPVTLTIVFLVGIKKMAAQKALVRNLAAVETLGMVTAIATDKTGTLTFNKLRIAELWDPGGAFAQNPAEAVWLSVSHKHPETQRVVEREVGRYCEELGKPVDWRELDDLPFDTARRFNVVLWENTRLRSYRVSIKGAPEPVIAACRLSLKDRKVILRQLAAYVKKGSRVIAIAQKDFELKPSLAALALEEMRFVGFICFEDGLRPEAAEAIALTRKAGIKVYLLTGDHLGTANTIAQTVGISTRADETVAGKVAGRLNTNQLNRLLEKVRVFGRILPEHKYKILHALKKTEIAAMTGDGVNDAPALAQADIGIAMGSGTDVAKEAADMVLLDDNYATIVAAIKQGRTIYANIRKMVFYLLSTNLAEVLAVTLSLVLAVPLPVSAVQILWINLVTDGVLVMPLGLEPPEADQLKTPPRRPDESLLSNHLAARLLLVGGVMGVSAFWIFVRFLPYGEAAARTMAFLALVVVQWANAFNARSESRSILSNLRTPNRKLMLGLGAGILLQLAVLVGPLKELMGIVTIDPDWLPALLVPVSLTIIAAEIHKWYWRNKTASRT